MRFALRTNYGEGAIWLLQDKTVKFQFIEEREQKLTLIFCNITIITPLRANIEQTQIIPYYPLTKRAKCDIKNL